jgi:glycosyltransferase involved in cell wall biosynthesis
MINLVSVIIPTYNPDVSRLNQTIEGLRSQTLDQRFWEILVIDNNSDNNFISRLELSWHKDIKILKEQKQGLTYARMKGFSEARGEILVLVDDDNVLNEHYLQSTFDIYNNYPALGAIGGKSIPIFENDPPDWLPDFYDNLALRDLGDTIIIDSWGNKFPYSAPIGAGMAIRKEALNSYIAKINSGETVITDRNATSLSSAGDNDIIIEILKSGWQTAYFPGLSLNHLIPKERLSVEYLSRLLNNSSKSWIELLDRHGINPWSRIPAWTVPIRKLRTWFLYGAWKSSANYIKWKGACGMFEGLSLCGAKTKTEVKD